MNKLHIPENPDKEKYVLEESFIAKATCKTCGEVIYRESRGAPDDWWYYEFNEKCENHKKVCN